MAGLGEIKSWDCGSNTGVNKGRQIDFAYIQQIQSDSAWRANQELKKVKDECESLRASLLTLANAGLIVKDPNNDGRWKSNFESVMRERDVLRSTVDLQAKTIVTLESTIKKLQPSPIPGSISPKARQEPWEIDDWDLLPDAD